jgi:hypothetical protein
MITVANELITNIRPASNPISICLPDDSFITSSHTCNIDIPSLPSTATEGHLFPEMGPTALLSIGKLCDAGCEATFNAHHCDITFMGDTILVGTRSQSTDKLWHLHQQPTTPKDALLPPEHNCDTNRHLANLITTNTASAKPADLILFAHAAFFSPTVAALTKALQLKFILHFPGLSLAALRKYPPHTTATAKGHMNQQRQGIQSTKKEVELPLLPEDTDLYPASDAPNDKTNVCFAAVIETTGRTFSDQTGRFLIPSSTGNNYVFVMYDYDSNSIHAEPMPNCTAKSHVTAYTVVHNKLVKAGLRPKMHMLDNECSRLLHDYINDNGTAVQLTPVCWKELCNTQYTCSAGKVRISAKTPSHEEYV